MKAKVCSCYFMFTRYVARNAQQVIQTWLYIRCDMCTDHLPFGHVCLAFVMMHVMERISFSYCFPHYCSTTLYIGSYSMHLAPCVLAEGLCL